jgi:hypothetical protein
LEEKGLISMNKVRHRREYDTESLRKKIQFHNEVQKKLRLAELAASQRGISTAERKAILMGAIRKHYPETLPNSEQIVLENLQKEYLEPGRN